MLRDRRRLLILGAAVALLVMLVWSMRPASQVPTSTPTAGQSRRGAQRTEPVPPGVPPVKLDALTAARQGPGDTDRNPFRYHPKGVPAPPRTVAPAPVPDSAEPPRPQVPAGPPPPPPIPLKFIGMLERANGVKWAVLSDGKNVMHGREGDIVDGRYRIVKIGTESLELTHLDGRGRQVVRLTGQ